MEALAALVEANEDAAAALAAAYEVLLGGVPNIAGFTLLIDTAVDSNFGSNDDSIVFNQENIFINITNALVQGNDDAKAAFADITSGAATLADKVEAIYNAIIPLGAQTAEGLAYLTRPEALEFYARVAGERGVAGPDGAAIVALASILNIAVQGDISGIGDSVNDLLAAIADGSAQLPASGNTFTPIEDADGTHFDGDDNKDGAIISLTDRVDAPGIDESQPGSGRDTTGTGFNDTYIATGATLNPGDAIAAGAGTDQILLNFIDQGLTILDLGTGFVVGVGLTVNLPIFEIESTGLEQVVVQLQGGNDILDNLLSPPLNPFEPIISGAEIDLSRSTDITDLSLERSTGIVRFSSIQNNVDINITDSVGWFQYIFDTGAVGAGATATINVDHAFAILDIETNGVDGFTDLVINTTDFNVLQISDNWDPNSLGLTSLTVTGAGTNVLLSGFTSPDLVALVGPPPAFITNEFSGLTSVDLSGNTGGTFVELLFNEQDLTFEGGSGNDIALLGSDAGGGFLTNDDSFDGGAGYDILGFGGDDLVGLDPATVQNFELFALFNDASGDDFKFENGGFGVDIALLASWNAELQLEDFDDNTVFVLTNLDNNGVDPALSFDDTDVANISVGLPIELATYAALGLDFLDELGLDAFIPLLTGGGIPFPVSIDVLSLNEVETANIEVGGGLLATLDTSLTLGIVQIDGTLGTIAASGTGDLIINDIVEANAGDDVDGLVFDLSALTGGFNGAGLSADLAGGPQTFIIGALGVVDGLANYDFDGDAANDDASEIALGAGDLFMDFVNFTDGGFGNLVIRDFQGAAGVLSGQQDILDFTALGVDEATDLNFDYATSAGNLIITSDLFDGSVLLVGIALGQFSNENLDLVA